MIVWLASYPRSGNTLLRMVLKRCFDLETYSSYDDRADIGARADVAAAVGHVMHGLDIGEFHARASASEETFVIKTHDAPPDDAPAIYVVRDGRSSCVSYFHYLREIGRLPVTMEDVIVGLVQFGSWSEHFAAWEPHKRPNTLLVRYEDILARPNDVLASLGAFVRRPVRQAFENDFDRMHTLFPQFFRTGRNEGNICELTAADEAVFRMMHSELMTELGYSHAFPDDTPYIRSSLIRMRDELSASRRREISLRDAANPDASINPQKPSGGAAAVASEIPVRAELEVRGSELKPLSERVESLQAELIDLHGRYVVSERDREARLRVIHDRDKEILVLRPELARWRECGVVVRKTLSECGSLLQTLREHLEVLRSTSQPARAVLMAEANHRNDVGARDGHPAHETDRYRAALAAIEARLAELDRALRTVSNL